MQVTLVELKDIQLPDSMKRAMARQAEAEREKRAKIIDAEGESLAAAALGDASDTMMAHPLALQLRNLQTLVELGVDKNTTVVFPAPLMSHHRRTRRVPCPGNRRGPIIERDSETDCGGGQWDADNPHIQRRAITMKALVYHGPGQQVLGRRPRCHHRRTRRCGGAGRRRHDLRHRSAHPRRRRAGSDCGPHPRP